MTKDHYPLEDSRLLQVASLDFALSCLSLEMSEDERDENKALRPERTRCPGIVYDTRKYPMN